MGVKDECTAESSWEMATDVCSCRALALYEGTDILCLSLFIVLMVMLDLQVGLACSYDHIGPIEIIVSNACLSQEGHCQ